MKENTGRTLALGLGAWGVAVFAGAAVDAYAKLPLELFAALAAFGSIFAIAVFVLDPQVRRFVENARWTPVAAAVLAALGAADLALAPWDERILALPHAPLVLFVLPLALAANAAVWERALFRSRETRSPGATPAAT